MRNTVLSRPVVLSYFAQSGDEEKGYLKSLEGESKSITEAWEQHHIQTGSNKYFEVFFPSRGSADGDKVAEDIRNYKNYIILFHFSGHATSKTLLFKDGASHARGIAGLLGEAPNLKLVVLNGCATYDQVKLLFENGIKIVIATRWKVSDEVARKFASTFYQALSTTDYTIKRAFQHALNELQRQYSSLESISTKPIIWRGLDTESEVDRDRWELYVGEEWEGLLDDPNWWRIGDLPSSYSKPATLLSPKGVDNPNVFIGREEELEAIREQLVKSGKLMLINAEGGIGKTTLAARYWNESLYEYQHIAWLFCENGIMNALKELAPSLNVKLTGLDEAQQLATLRHALKQVQDDFLLVLDNANDADDIRTFRQEFAGFHWHVLITSRCQGILDPKQELTITHLPPPLAKKLFEEYYTEGTPDFDALLERLLKAIGYHTLLVELFAKNLREASELGTSLVDFLQKLETEGLYLGENTFDIQTPYTGYVQKAAATTDEILDILYDFSTLSEEQRYLLVNLALLPAESYTMLFLIEVMAPADKTVFHKTLKGLYQKGWVGGVDKTYRLSPVVQALVLVKNKETPTADSEALLKNLAKKMANDGANFKHLRLPEAAPLAHLAGTITQNLLHTPTRELASLNFNAGIYFESTGDIVQAEQAFEKCGEISTAIGDIENVAASYSKLGDIYNSTGNWKNALHNYQQQLCILKDIHQSSPENLYNKYNLALLYGRLGGIFKATGDWEKALRKYQQQLLTFKSIFKSSSENLNYENGLVGSYEKLGNIYEMRAECWNKALENYQKCNELALKIHRSSPKDLMYMYNLAVSYQNLGNTCRAIQDWDEALRNYQDYNKLMLKIHKIRPENLTYKNGLAISYSKLGGYYLLQKDDPTALSYYEHSLTLSNDLWQSTQGQIVALAFTFAIDCWRITDIVKGMILAGKFDAKKRPQETNRIKAMRREGFTALQPSAKAGALQQNQLQLLQELADESWYNF